MLNFQDVAKKYNEDRYVLKDITFELPAGSFVALNGPSGSGKTTLLNICAGLDDPSQGKVFVLGQDLSQLTSHDRSLLRLNKMGFVFQAYNLLPVLTAVENVEFTCLLKGLNRSEARKKAMSALDEVGLSEFAHRKPSLLSGGQQQRVAVARSIAGDPQMIFADEPTANLDSKNAFQLIELFRRLNREHSVSFVFSTHDQRLSDAVDLCIYLQDGVILEQRKKT